jgi:hypothetical protein
MSRAFAGGSISAIRLGVAAAILVAVSYVLSWQILFDGLPRGDTLFHLHLTTFVASTFPGSPSWWYPWDGNGLPFREGYPLVSHWLAVAASRLDGTNLTGGIQLIDFLVSPLCALGVYAFCDWRLRRPLAGLIAGVLYLISPMSWFGLFNLGIFTDQVSTVLFMPAIIALDAAASSWASGQLGWGFRSAIVAFCVLATGVGLVAPAQWPGAVLAVPLYALAMPAAARRRWLIAVTPALWAVSGMLALFWLFPIRDYLGFIGTRSPSLQFNPADLSLLHLDTVLQLHPLSPASGDRYSLTPAASIPALLGVVAAVWERRARVLVLLVGLALVFGTQAWALAPLGLLPNAQQFTGVVHRPAVLYLQFFVPILAGLGLVVVPLALLSRLARKTRSPAVQGATHSTVAANAAARLIAVVAFAALVLAFAGYVGGNPGHLSYGPEQADLRDIWRTHDSSCPYPGGGDDPLCKSVFLSTAFSVSELSAACRDAQGHMRTDVAICAAIGAPDHPNANVPSSVVQQTLSWCDTHADAICRARYLSLSEQLLDPSHWRAPSVGCSLTPCREFEKSLAALQATFPQPPQRAAVNSDNYLLGMAFHEISGGASDYTYAGQLVPSESLNSWLVDNTLHSRGTVVKSELAQALGLDTVALAGPTQLGLADDYRALGWQLVGQANGVDVFHNASPRGLAEQWPSGSNILVIGASQSSSADVYNNMFKYATSGRIPYAEGWLVRGRSPYVDDYSAAELSSYRAVVLLGYRYHDHDTAWNRVDQFAMAGGRVYVETGWQYVDPDWNSTTAPQSLPVADLHWGPVDPTAPVTVAGVTDQAFGSLSYQGGGWGASSSTGLRPGAEALVTVGNRIVVARWARGKGEVVWSGMNLLAHDSSAGSSSEDTFVTNQFRQLLPVATPQIDIVPSWTGNDEVVLPLTPTNEPSLVLFKESLFPGWSARLDSGGTSRTVSIVSSEMDFMLVHLDSVPVGSRLVFTYAPTFRLESWWALSTLAMAGLLVWLFAPELARRPLRWMSGRVNQRWSRARFRWEDDE